MPLLYDPRLVTLIFGAALLALVAQIPLIGGIVDAVLVVHVAADEMHQRMTRR